MSNGAGTNGFILTLIRAFVRTADERMTEGELPADALSVRSSLDRTFKLASRVNERMVIGKDDVTVIKNHHESLTAQLHVTGEEMHVGRTVFRPSRQQSFVVWKGRDVDFELAPGESCVVRSEYARNPSTSIYQDRGNPMGM